MRILLAAVNAKYIHSNLAVCSLRASAGKYAPLVELAEYTVNQRTEEIFRDVYARRPQLLFLSCYIWNRRILVELAEDLQRVLPDLRIWAGGPEVSYDAEEFLGEHPQFVGVMRGEGERTFRRLLAYYADGIGSLEDIEGITFRAGTADGEASPAGRGIRSNPPQPPAKTLDELPFVYRHPEDFAHRIIYYESSRGCPFCCSYCLSSLDRHVRFRSVELVEQELSVFLEHRTPLVKFTDRTFNADHARTLRLWRFLKEHDNGVSCFHFEIGADLLNEEELELLGGMRPGLIRLEIGVQSVNPRTLDAIHRNARFDEIARRVERISAAGNVHQHLDLIAGLPFEDFESFGRSFDAVYRLHPQELQLGFLKVLRGSEMHRRAQEYGLIFRSQPPYEVLETDWISCQELLRLKEIEEMLEVYYNSGQFRNTVRALEELFERPFALYGALADFDRETRAPGQQYSRPQRFAFLRSFLRQLPAARGKQEYFDELLTLDCYLRENAKTRPEWAADRKSYREQAADFYRREEKERRYLPHYRDMTWKQLMRMSHLERFVTLSRRDMRALSGRGPQKGPEGNKGRMEEMWVLFDYSRRNPVTGDAAACIVELP